MPDMNENAETQQEYFGKAKLETDYKDLSMRLYKRIADLEKENAELKNKLEHRNCLDCSNHSSKLRMRTLELEKENAELKERVSELTQELDDVINRFG